MSSIHSPDEGILYQLSMTDKPHHELDTMSLGEHLEELRRRIIWSIIPPLPLAVIFFLLSDPIVKWFLIPLHNVLEKHGLPTQVQVLSPPEFLIAEMKIALGAAILTSGPWILYQLWKFISPGLHKHERRFVYFLIPFSTLLGILGLVLMYFAMLPVILNFMVTLAGNIEVSEQTISVGSSISPVQIPVLESQPQTVAIGDAWISQNESVLTVAATEKDGIVHTLSIPMNSGTVISQQFQLSSYLNFVIMLMFSIAIAFQLPMVMLLLGWLGALSPDWLKKNRRYALLVLAVISAIITPQDVISMLMMLIPLYLLYELGIQLIIWVPTSRVAGEIDED
ncbi:MAG: twin-arginine translocase subunit TatC [Phycisphaerales bacterium]|jgi:Tat protein translocase TatC|nr:twin-arginine translocase subunit TatC [Phycisphaerales bacterium]